MLQTFNTAEDRVKLLPQLTTLDVAEEETTHARERSFEPMQPLMSDATGQNFEPVRKSVKLSCRISEFRT